MLPINKLNITIITFINKTMNFYKEILILNNIWFNS